MELLLQELDNMRKNKFSEREDHWNSYIAALQQDHSKALSDADVLVKQMQEDMEMVNDSVKV